MIILDTSVLIDHTRQRNLGRKTLFERIVQIEGSFNIGVSIITLQELYQGFSTRENKKEEEMLDTLGLVKIFAYDEGTATTAGKIVRDWNPEMEFADAAIAATAINEDCHLFTVNTGDFQNIPDLTLYHLPLWK